MSGLRIQSSVYGAVIPIVYGQNRLPGNLIWYGDFATAYNTVGGKGGLFGGGGKGGQQVPNYSAAIAMALCEGPIENVYTIWDTQGASHVSYATENYSIPNLASNESQAIPASAPYTVTVTNAANFEQDIGVKNNALTVSFTRVVSGPTAGQYSVNESTGVYTFSAANAGQTVRISYGWNTGTGLTFTVANAANFYGNSGVQRDDSYDMFVEVYNGSSVVVQHLEGSQLTPMEEVVSSPAKGQYSQDGAGNYTFSSLDAGKTLSVSYFYFVPGNAGASSPQQNFNFITFPGARPQTAWSYLTTNHPGEALAYSGLAYMASPSVNLGGSGVLPNWSFEVLRRLNTDSAQIDENPALFMEDLLTNEVYGADSPWPTAEIGDWDNFSDYCIAHGLFMSPVLNQQRKASDWFKDFLLAANAEPVWSGGKLKIITYGDDAAVANGAAYTPNTTPVYDLNDDDFIREDGADPIQVERPSVQDAYNSISVEFLNRANSYNPEIVEARDQNAVELYGLRKQDPIQMHFITTKDVAAKVAQTLLSRSVYVRNIYTFTLTAAYILAEPMDLVTLTDEALGLNATPVRIKTIEETDDHKLKFTAEEFPWGVSSPTLYPKQDTAPGGPQADANPGVVNDPIIFEALSRMNDQIGHSIWFGLSGQSADWGGCNIWISMDDVSYKQIGTAIQKSRMGELTATFPSGSDPDTVNTLAIDVSESDATLDGGSATDADDLLTLSYVDGELVAYSDAVLTAPGEYDMDTYIRRGQLGSTISSHASGSKFLRLDNAVTGWDYDVSLIGKTVYFKFTSYNLRGLNENDLAAVTAYPFLITGACIGLLTPAHSSYRPLSNPLTATDAGATASIIVDSFIMRVPGIPDVSLNSGAITGLDFETLYYVYYDDPGFIGGTVAYQVTEVQEDALNSAGRFFVGSIRTPGNGQPDTTGNDDGGAGAQLGMVSFFYPAATVDPTSVVGNGVVTNPFGWLDSNRNTYTTFSATGNSGSNSAYVAGIAPYITFSGTTRKFKSMKLKVLYEVIQNSLNGSPDATGAVLIGVNAPIGVASLIIVLIQPGGGAVALTTAELDLDPTINIGSIMPYLQARTTASSTTGVVELRVHDMWIEAIE